MSAADPEQPEYPPWSSLHVGLQHPKNLVLYARRQANVPDGIRVVVLQAAHYRDPVVTIAVERMDGGRLELDLNDGDDPGRLAARIEAAARTLMAQQ
ncbi:hypothetical protein [Microbacterium sp. MMO-10]|uniref:hypothetical protein n=1 Tax=Microbacterium sp. MMO-10 TaxID=3081272 RepID=UPI003016DF9A